jgi:hypothetical protein
MHIVAVHNWQKEDVEVAKIIAEKTGTLAFEARQKISGGGPAVLASFAVPQQAEALAGKLSQAGVPALVIDTAAVRSRNQPLQVCRFVLAPQMLQLESFNGKLFEVDYDKIELQFVAICSAGQTQKTTTEIERKFSLGKTLLAGGVPMTKKVKSDTTVNVEERDETLWLYVRGGATVIFNRGAMSYDGLGDAMQLTRDLNFAYLKTELQRHAPQADYDDRLLKRAALIRLLGPALNPETDFDLACEILSRSLREKSTPVSLPLINPEA